ncbi:MAG: esterase [Candidatus Tectimicrobiota bacterium]|nr:MAG: esterase [Candidatus Tectomicrobia bacterium]
MQAVDALLIRATQEGALPGAVLCVGVGSQLVWQRAYGAAALVPAWRPMHCDTLFDVASLTKVVATTSLVLLACHHGLCQLDDPLRRFLPVPAPLGNVTLRQLLAHSGGLAAWLPLYRWLLPHGPQPCTASQARLRLQQAVAHIAATPLAYCPGTEVRYSDLGFILLGAVLEAVYAQTLDRLFIAHVACPLGLRATAYRPLYGPSPLPESPQAYAATEACPWRGRVLAGEVHDENAWALGGVAGHAGLFATAADLWRFATALLEAAAGRHDWLPAPLVRLSWQRQAPGSTRALGWDTPSPGQSSAGELFSPQSVGHLGFTGCSLWLDPCRGVSVVLCTNRVHPHRQNPVLAHLRPQVHNLVMRALGVSAP